MLLLFLLLLLLLLHVVCRFVREEQTQSINVNTYITIESMRRRQHTNIDLSNISILLTRLLRFVFFSFFFSFFVRFVLVFDLYMHACMTRSISWDLLVSLFFSLFFLPTAEQ